MRITDLLDRRSVSLTAAPKTRSETLEKIAPVLIYPVVGILVMGLLMTFIVEPVMLLFTHHYPARCFGINMPKSRDIPRDLMRLA